jgi:hypothetical protein
MTDPKPPETQVPTTPGPVLSGRDDATPVRAFNRVALVIFVVFAIVCAVAYGLWTSLN